MAKITHEINEQIRDPQIRLIGETGEQLGVMPALEANQIADEKGLDLVKISPNSNPPVCKLMDYSKYCYEKKKKEKEARKNGKVVEAKEIRLHPNIDTADYETKVRAAIKFLESGKRVKISVMFRGREMAHTKIGLSLLRKFIADCSAVSVHENEPAMNGRSMVTTLCPRIKK